MKKLNFVFLFVFLFSSFSFGQELTAKSKTLLRGIRYDLVSSEYFLGDVAMDRDVSLMAYDDGYVYSAHRIKLYSATADSVLSLVDYAIDFFIKNEKGTTVVYRDLAFSVDGSQIVTRCRITSDDGYKRFSLSELKKIKKSLLNFINHANN